MTAPRITAEEIAQYREDMSTARVIASIAVADLRRILDALESAYAELDRLSARLEISDDHPFDGIECRNLTIRGLEQDIASMREQLRVARLSAQCGEVPDLTDDEIDSRIYRQPAGPCDDEDWARWSHRECRWAYHLALSRVRHHVTPAPPHPDTVEVPPPGFEISEYAAIHHPGMLHGLPKICKRGPGAWAAFVDDTSCMGRDGEVYYEPRPSNRTPEFIALTRFETPAEAADALRAQAQPTTNETRG